MRRRTTYTPGSRSDLGYRRPRGRSRRLVLVSSALAVLTVSIGTVVATPVAGHADPRRADAGVVVLIDCVRAWVRGADGAFATGGVCDAARAQLAARISSSPSQSSPSSRQSSSPSRAAASSSAPAASAPSPSPDATRGDAQVAPSAAPSSSATPSAIPSAIPSASASASASAADVDGARVPEFGSRPESGAITCSGQTGVVVRGRTFRGIRNDTPAITIDGCHDVLIVDNDFDGDAEPIFVRNSTDVRIVGNRYKDIAGPHERNGSHRGNFTQWENSFGGEISGNSGVGGDTEDVISIYKSGGTSAADPLVISGNVFQGTDWTSASGSGIMLGDGGGDHVLVQHNTLIDVGQVGIGIAGGEDIRVLDNTIVGRARPHSNVGIYTWGQGASCGGLTVARNRIDFVKADGTRSPLWDGGNCGAVDGWSTNLDGRLDPAGLLPIL